MNNTETHDEKRQGEILSLDNIPHKDGKRKMYIESYGCAMNFSDSEIVASILTKQGFSTTTDMHDADVILVNTCAIRDNAEQRIRGRLKEYKAVKKHNKDLIVGVMGCMVERLKSNLLEEEKLVDIVVGPDAYRDLPNLINRACVDCGNSATSSKKMVPPFATSKYPLRASCAPVNEPFSCPNNSESIVPSGIAPQFTAMNEPCLRVLN